MLYTTNVVTLIEHRHLSVPQYADDMQVYGHCHPNDATSLCSELVRCTEQVTCWVSANHLQLDAAKMEFLWLIPPGRRHQLPTNHLVVRPAQVAPVASTWCLPRQ